MRNTRLLLLAAVGMLLALLCWPATAQGDEAPQDLFLGTWHVTMTPDEASRLDGAKQFTDAMVFADGQLLAELFAFYGFAPGVYTVGAEPPNSFTAANQSGSKGTLSWSGSAGACHIQGVLLWTKTDGKVWRLVFTGTR